MSARFVDIELNCRDCGILFLFSGGEQHLFTDRGWPPPKRCPACRLEARARRDAATSAKEGANHGTTN